MRFGERDYFAEKEKGNARDGRIDAKPVDPRSYKGLLSNLYKEEIEFQKAAQEKFDQVVEEADQLVQKGKYEDALIALQSYPREYRSGTKYGKLLEQKIQEVSEQEKQAKKAKKSQKK